MTASEEMVDEVKGILDVCSTGMRDVDDERYAAQAVVDAAWTRFDPLDESTWPDGYSYEYVDVYFNRICWHATSFIDDDGDQVVPTHYANPDHLRPSSQ